MDEPLWTEKHRPHINDLPQPTVREYLEAAVGESFNLLLCGPRGAGKTAAARAYGDASHDNPDSDFMIINVADVFNRSKSDIRDDPRFAPFLQGQTPNSKQYRQSSGSSNKYKRRWSKRAMLAHVLKEIASYSTESSDHQTIVLDNAEAMRGDFQQALRRIMEQNHATTQFIIVTRSASTVIPALQSRCSLVPMESPSVGDIQSILRGVADEEDVEYDDEGLEFISGYSNKNIRTAVLALQTVASHADTINGDTAATHLQNVGVQEQITQALNAAENDNLSDARSIIDTLLVDEGMQGREILRRLAEQTQYRYDEPESRSLIEHAADTDMDLIAGSSDRVHLTNYLTTVARVT